MPSKIGVMFRSSLGRVPFDDQISSFNIAEFAEFAGQDAIGWKVTNLGYFRDRTVGVIIASRDILSDAPAPLAARPPRYRALQ